MVDVRLPTDRETGRPRGFAFVEFSSESECEQAIARFNDREVGGRRLKVNAADDRPSRAGGPPSRGPSRSFGAPMGAQQDFAPSEDPFGGGLGGARRPFKNKGSRRGMRGRKRSLNF